jgi:hypothetical protein
MEHFDSLGRFNSYLLSTSVNIFLSPIARGVFLGEAEAGSSPSCQLRLADGFTLLSMHQRVASVLLVAYNTFPLSKDYFPSLLPPR